MSLGLAGIWMVVGLSLTAVGVARRPVAARVALGAAGVGTVLVMRLAWAFASRDWSFGYVADNSRSGVGPLLRISGLWAGPEGSLLLWTVILAWVVVVAVRLLERSAATEVMARAWAVRLGSGLTAAYGMVLALTASPFDRPGVPAVDGLGLQPVLEHPAMIWHPPLLYAGLIGLLVPSIMAAAGCLAARPLRLPPVVLLVPLALLAAGLASGALWSNVEIGWGGYWAWDPIESAGLVAWLCGAAALHAVRWPDQVVSLDRAAAALLVVPGLAAVWATTLTRIGVIESVHAFADRPALRIGLLAVAALTTAAVAATIAAAGRTHADAVPERQAVLERQAVSGREVVAEGVAVLERQGDRAGAEPDAGLAAGEQPVTDRVGPALQGRRLAVVVLATAALFVAVGTYEPLVEAASSGDAVAIAGRYYSRLLWPVTVVGCALAVRADRRWWPAVAGAVVGGVVVPLGAGPFALAVGAGGGAVAGSAVATAAARRRGAIAHLGVGVLLVGVAGTMASTRATADLAVDATVEVAGAELTHRSIELVDGPATREAVAAVDVDGASLAPRLVSYRLRGTSTAEVANRFTLLDEIQVLLLDGDATRARYRVNHIPRVGLVWLGAGILVAGLAGQGLRRRRPVELPLERAGS